MPKVTDIRNAMVSELETLTPDTVVNVLSTLDDRATYTSALPMLRVARGDSDIDIGSLSEWEHTLSISITYVDYLNAGTDDRIDYALESITQLITRSDTLAAFIDSVAPTNISIDEIDSDDPLIAAEITFTITYSEGV